MPPTSCRHQNALIAEATEHFDKGCAAIKAGDMEEAITLLAKALELRTEVYGEEDIQCASAYYKYGCALFYKAQDENTIFGKQGQAAVDKQTPQYRRRKPKEVVENRRKSSKIEESRRKSKKVDENRRK